MQVLKQVDPQCIVTSSKTDETMINFLKETYAGKSEEPESSSSKSFNKNRINLVPNIEFAFESCRHYLQNLDLPSAPQNMTDTERQIFFSSLIDFTSTCMVKAAGGLLKFIEKQSGIKWKMLTSKNSLPIMAIRTLLLKNCVTIDENSYKALQIFQDERHPSVYKSGYGIKEGLSLYGICNKCKSSIGKKELRRWFLMPTNDPIIIQERQAAIKYFSTAKNSEILSALQNSLKNIKFLPKIFSRMKTAQASMNDWKILYKTAFHATVIGEISRTNSSFLKIFQEITESFTEDLFRIASLLDKIIDFEEYTRQNHFAVKSGVDDEIDKMKRIYNGLPDFMTQVAHQELQELSTDIQQCSVIYLPQLGYLLAIPMTEHMKETKDYMLPNLKYMFILNDTVHYKSASTSKLDSLLGDTLCEIYDKETQIMHKLQNVVLEKRHVFISVMNFCAKLDCLLSLAITSREFNWVQPEIATDGNFNIVQARHPLQELCVASFVPNDIYSGAPGSRIKVLTGPNSCGKSTYLKQVALIAFLAHIGCFVPAQKAKIPLLDSIFSCIQASESVSINLSSFFSSLKQLSLPLNNASENTLVIIDEFGKDTEPASGLALLASSLKYWLQKESQLPHVFLATHYFAISSYFADNPLIEFQTMDLLVNEELVFFHQLISGVANCSYAANAALQAGLPRNLVMRAISVMDCFKENKPVIPNDTEYFENKLKRYLDIYNAFLDVNADSDSIESFLKLIQET